MIRTAMEKVVIVGAGMTGTASAFFMRQTLQSLKIKIIEKSQGVGGRMSTSRSRKANSASVDLGAQYISVTPEYASKHKSVHDELINSKVLQPSTCLIEGDNSSPSTTHYIAPEGVGSVVKYFLEKSGAETVFNEVVTRVDIEDDKVKVTSQGGWTEICDGIVLTMPVPQILQLQGSVRDLIDSNAEVKARLQGVSYSSRFALGMYYDPGTNLDYPWAGKYVTDNPCVRFVAIDSKKRGKENSDVGPSVAVHTGVPFGLENLEKNKENMESIILEQVKAVLPNLPDPAEVKVHKWRYSQVHVPYPGSPGCVVLSDRPLVLLAGDGFSHSNMDGCLSSAITVKNTFLTSCGKL